MTDAPAAAAHMPDLMAMIQAYNEVTERLKHSHELLTREVIRLRNELSEKNRELQRRERLAALGEMAAGVAHEIRNPLGGIDLYTSLLERDLVEHPRQLEIVRKVRVGVRSVEKIVGDVLSFAGPVEPNRRPTAISGILESVLAQVAPAAQAHETRLETARELPKIELYCDACQIERALVNLLCNAIEAAGEGGCVWVRRGKRLLGQPSERSDGLASEDGVWLCPIIIEDDGPGVSPELAQRVFDPFFTTKDTGTGLGLAIVHRIAESHGGYVKVSLRDGGGAAFELALPIWDRSVDGWEQAAPSAGARETYDAGALSALAAGGTD